MLATAPRDQLQSLVEMIEASAAVIALGADAHEHGLLAHNERFAAMTGRVPPETPTELSAALPRYARGPFSEALRACAQAGAAVEFEQAFDLPGGVRWWRLTAKPLAPHDPLPRLLVTGLDITARVALERELQQTASRFASVVDAAYDGIVTIDQRERIVLFNRAAEEIFGYRAAELLGRRIEVLVPSHHREAHGEYVERFARSPIPSRQMHERQRVFGRRKDGSEFPVEIAISKITVAGAVEFTAIVRDVSERVRLLEELQRRAITDPLTGVTNRREFAERAERMVREARGAGRPLAVVVLDVDRFKSVNDRYGHATGDEVLRALATTAAATVHHDDVFARMGGEEFAALLPGSDLEGAARMAERLRRIFSEGEFVFPWSGRPVAFTVSLGVSLLGPGETGIDAALDRADRALYRAKGGGRDRVEVEPPGASRPSRAPAA